MFVTGDFYMSLRLKHPYNNNKDYFPTPLQVGF